MPRPYTVKTSSLADVAWWGLRFDHLPPFEETQRRLAFIDQPGSSPLGPAS
jgi:hypothetical protein